MKNHREKKYSCKFKTMEQTLEHHKQSEKKTWETRDKHIGKTWENMGKP